MNKFSPFETVLITVFQNATTKFISGVQLYSGKISYNDSHFLSIIAQEELAKMFILPIARELGEIELINADRKSPFYKHAIKQKIFTNWGLQDRTHADIETRKQNILYVGIDNEGKVDFEYVKPEAVLDEIKHLALLLVHTYVDVLSQDEFNKEFKKGMKFFMDIAYSCAETDLPELSRLIATEAAVDNAMKPDRLKEKYTSRILSNPYELIKICKAVFKEEYKRHLRSISSLSFAELEEYLGKYYASK